MPQDFSKTISQMDKIKTKKNRDRSLEEQVNLIEQAKLKSQSSSQPLYTIPTNSDRSFAAFIDLTCSFFIAFILCFLFQSKLDSIFLNLFNLGNVLNETGIDSDTSSSAIISAILHTMYPVILTIVILGIMGFFTGHTPGTKLYRLNIYDYKSKEQISVTRRTTRAVLFVLDMIFLFGIGSLTGFMSPEGRTMQDKLCRTILLKNKK